MEGRRRVRMQVYEYGDLPKGTTSTANVNCIRPAQNQAARHRAIVIPTAGIEYDLASRNADIIITERGGPLSHLATVSREKGKVLIRVNDAVKRFPLHTYLVLNFEDLTLKCEKY